jgi:WD40 repeat protein
VVSSIGADGTLTELTLLGSDPLTTQSDTTAVTSVTPYKDHFLLSCSDGTVRATAPVVDSSPVFSEVNCDALDTIMECGSAVRRLAVNDSATLWALVDQSGRLSIITPAEKPVADFTPQVPRSEAPISIAAVQFVPGAEMVVLTGDDDRCRILDFTGGRWNEFPFPLTSRGLTLAAHPAGQLIACGGEFEKILVIRAADHQLVCSLPGGIHTNCCRFTSDGEYLVSGHDDGYVRVWDVDGGALHRSIRPHQNEVIDFVLLDSARLLISVDKAGRVVLSDLTAAETYGTLYQTADRAVETDLLPRLAFNERTIQALAVLPGGPNSTELLKWQLNQSDPLQR